MRVVALIAPSSPDSDREILASRIAKIAIEVAALLGDVATVRWAVETTAGPKTTASSLSTEISEFAAVLEVVVADEDDLNNAITAISGLGERLGDAANTDESVLVVGPEHVVVAGRGELQIHVALRRNPNIDHEEYLRIWEEEFAPIAATTPHMAGYIQIPNLFEQSAKAAATAGFGISDVDGIALEWFPSADQLQEAALWSEESTEHVTTRQRFLNEGEARSLLSDNPS